MWEASRKASRATSSGTPAISKMIRPGLTTATQYSGVPLPLPVPSTAPNADPDAIIDDPQLAARLERESEADYSARVYREYVSAKQQLGENVSNIPKERFDHRLKGRADALVQKHGCRMVRFQVSTENQQVVLRPVVIR